MMSHTLNSKMNTFTKLILSITCISLIAIFTFCGWYIASINKPLENKQPVKTEVVVNKLKVVFVVTNKDIDFNKMAINEIIDIIQKDSILQINSITPEIYIKPQIIKVYKIEDITCPFLKKKFKNNSPGELVYEYNEKILIKLNDGVVKVYHSHIIK